MKTKIIFVALMMLSISTTFANDTLRSVEVVLSQDKSLISEIAITEINEPGRMTIVYDTLQRLGVSEDAKPWITASLANQLIEVINDQNLYAKHVWLPEDLKIYPKWSKLFARKYTSIPHKLVIQGDLVSYQLANSMRREVKNPDLFIAIIYLTVVSLAIILFSIIWTVKRKYLLIGFLIVIPIIWISSGHIWQAVITSSVIWLPAYIASFIFFQTRLRKEKLKKHGWHIDKPLKVFENGDLILVHKNYINGEPPVRLFDRKYKMKEYKQLLSSDIDASILSIDKKLYQLTKDFEILNYINPVNIEAAKRDFFKSKFTANPNFVYKPLNINPHEFKRSLYSINVEKIHDISWRILYQDIISSYADKIDIIHSIGTDKFKYNSLLYFGEPDETDVKNAEYILHCATSHEKKANELGAHEALLYIKKTIESYGFPCKVEVSKHTTSKVLALSSKKTIRIRKDARFNKAYLKALAEHEVGVHMLTTANASNQKLKAFLLGTPVNTHTQEGLALLAEYLSGACPRAACRGMHVCRLRVNSWGFCLVKLPE